MTAQTVALPSGTRNGRLAPEEYVRGILAGERGVLSRFITLLESRLVEDRRLAQSVLTNLLPHAGRSVRVGITGVPGAGKSTLIESLGLMLTGQGHRVAVLAVDPTSRISGGSRLSLSGQAFIAGSGCIGEGLRNRPRILFRVGPAPADEAIP